MPLDDGPVLAGFDIGGSYINLGMVDGDGAVRHEGRLPTPGRDWAAFVAAIDTLLREAGGPPGAPIALSLAGIVDPLSGLARVANIPCLTGRPLARDLGAALARPVFIANDADCFVLAEAALGPGRGHRVVFGVILGTGVGGGLVIDGHLIPASGGVAGEWGHGPVVGPHRLKPSHPGDDRWLEPFACGCGQTGCVDTVGGARGLERLHEAVHGRRADSKAILADWLAGDGSAAATVDLYLSLVAGPLALVVNTIGASVLPVGGGLASVPDLISALDAAVRRRILRTTDAPLLVPARHHRHAGVIGAAILARQGLKI